MHLAFADDTFDAILCNHVLEHVHDDHRAMAEMARVLKPGGWAVLQVPVDLEREHTFEDPTITDPADRARLFGQWDHVRVYGRDYAQRLQDAGFTVCISRAAYDMGDAATALYGLRPEPIFVCRRNGDDPRSAAAANVEGCSTAVEPVLRARLSEGAGGAA